MFILFPSPDPESRDTSAESPSISNGVRVCLCSGYSNVPNCHGMSSLPLLHPPLATSDPIRLHSASSASALLQFRSVPVQLVQLCHAHSQTNHGSIPDLFGPCSHAKGHRLYTLSIFVLFA